MVQRKPKLVIVVGPVTSGKTTYANKKTSQGFLRATDRYLIDDLWNAVVEDQDVVIDSELLNRFDIKIKKMKYKGE